MEQSLALRVALGRHALCRGSGHPFTLVDFSRQERRGAGNTRGSAYRPSLIPIRQASSCCTTSISLSRIPLMQPRSNRPTPPNWPPSAMRPRPAPSQPGQRQTDQYDSFNASLLYCGQCRQATPTRQRLLLVLPTGNLYEYFCAQCGASTGSKTESASAEGGLLAP